MWTKSNVAPYPLHAFEERQRLTTKSVQSLGLKRKNPETAPKQSSGDRQKFLVTLHGYLWSSVAPLSFPNQVLLQNRKGKKKTQQFHEQTPTWLSKKQNLKHFKQNWDSWMTKKGKRDSLITNILIAKTNGTQGHLDGSVG